ncbi:RNase P/MRP, p29 subunit [Dendrothele bispora CBS 962.96]|uniref:Ribonuclease P protein subunit n=1 Tax=Dendrothele bispora (strain CBS 962.96) TaxID=1314807 RepID=A0A4S8KM43_DENBC|nr:RNase P/MRP, p29 subunit [Dendrothele bispora CBS 962.96]
MSSSKAGQSSATTLDIYDELAFIHGQKITLTSAAPFTPSFVLSSVAQSSDPTEVYVDRVRGRKILLENPAKVSRAQKEQEKKEERRKEAKKNKNKNRLIMSRKEAKVKGVWRLEKEQARFELFVPLHHLWMGYISELMGLPQSSSVSGVPTLKDAPSAVGMHPKLVKADFHGSLLTVKQSKCPSLVGLSGIVIHETENTFRIITPENKDKLLPKQNTIFTFSIPLFSTLPPTHTPEAPLPMPDPRSQSDSSAEATTTVTVLDMPHLEFDLYGNQFRFRSAERAGRKFKPKETIEL